MTDGRDTPRLRAPRARPRASRADGVICVSEYTAARGPAPARRARRRRSRSPRTASTPPIRDAGHRSRGRGRAGPPRPAPRRHPLRGQRGEAQEPREPGHGLHGPLAPAPAPAAAGAGGPGLGVDAGRHRRRARRSAPPATCETREIRALMAASALLVLPSLEEGFGLPVAEAMAAGLPVVCSRGSALEEVAGDAAHPRRPPGRRLDRRRASSGCSTTRRYAESLRRSGPRAQPRFDWDRTAQQTLDFYRKVLESGSLSRRRRAVSSQGRPTGTGRYLRSLLRRWTERVATTGSSPTSTGPLLRTTPSSPRPRCACRRWATGAGAASRWQEARLPAAVRADDLDVFFAPAYTCPPRPRVPRVTAVHDLSFFSYPADFSCREALRRRVLVGLSVRASSAVLACSAFTAPRDRRALPGGREPRACTSRSAPTTTCPPAPPRADARGPRSALRGPAAAHRGHAPEPALPARPSSRPRPCCAPRPRPRPRRGRREPHAPVVDLRGPRAASASAAACASPASSARTGSPTATPPPTWPCSCPSTRASACPPSKPPRAACRSW